MKKLKYQILFVILFMTIGVAAVTTNLITNGSTSIASNPDDFDVYFSDVSTASSVDSYQIVSSKSIKFNSELKNINQYSLFEFMVTNASKNYDADVSLSCEADTEYISIDYNLYNSVISARTTEMGYVRVALIKTYTGSEELNVEINCSISASAVERNTQVSDSVDSPIYYVGQEITIGSEKFNVISSDSATVTMLAQKGIDSSYKQSDSPSLITFADASGWDYAPGPYDVNVLQYIGGAKTYLENYLHFLTMTFGAGGSSIKIITLKDLINLGCNLRSDYEYDPANTCSNTSYSSWINNGQSWWVASAWPGHSDVVWKSGEDFSPSNMANLHSVRPVITVSKELLNKRKITFTIFGEEHIAYEGMTWAEWIFSAYNTIGCVVKDGSPFCSIPLSISGAAAVIADSAIREGESYIALNGGSN